MDSIALSAPPLYQQVGDVLRQQIERGQYPVGSAIPTEHELAKVFGVSRATIRNAIRSLANDGLVKAQPGVGTLIIRTRPQTNSSTLRGLTEDLRAKGFPTEAVVLESKLIAAPPSARAQLHLYEGERVLHLKRLRTIAGTPFALLSSYFPESVGIGANEDFSGPIYDLVEQSHRLHISYGKDVIGARAASAQEADLLQVAVGTPLLVIRRTAFLEYDKPVEYVEASIRGDLYEYNVTLPR